LTEATTLLILRHPKNAGLLVSGQNKKFRLGVNEGENTQASGNFGQLAVALIESLMQTGVSQ